MTSLAHGVADEWQTKARLRQGADSITEWIKVPVDLFQL